MNRLLRGLRTTSAATAPDAEDPALRGRTYAIPFDDVWQAALDLARGGMPGWHLIEADDFDGVIRAGAESRIARFAGDVTIRITLDLDAQTRVDATSTSRDGRADLGANARRLEKFFRALDRALAGREARAIHAPAGR